MAKKNASQPMNPFHPGEILLDEFLRPGKTTQAAFARKIGSDLSQAERRRRAA